jgi:hypothetical protein
MELAIQTMMKLCSQLMRVGVNEAARLEFEVEVDIQGGRKTEAGTTVSWSSQPHPW